MKWLRECDDAQKLTALADFGSLEQEAKSDLAGALLESVIHLAKCPFIYVKRKATQYEMS